MKEIVSSKCDVLISNMEKLSKEFKWNDSLINVAAALVFSSADRDVDVEKVKECKNLIAKNTGVFSSFRSTAEPIIASKMSVAADPLQYLNDLKMVYEKVSKGMFSDSSYMIQAAISLCDADKVLYADTYVAKFKELYKKMSKEHPILTSSEDMAFAMLLVLTDKPVDTIIREMEECYNYLKKTLKVKVGTNEMQGLSEVLAMTDGNLLEKCDKVVNIYNTFASHGQKYGAEYNEFASLAALIDIDIDTDDLVDEIIETAEYLKNKKGFGGWSMDRKQRLMFAAMIVADAYNADGAVTTYSAINSTVAMVIAEEVAIMICMMTVATVATTTN